MKKPNQSVLLQVEEFKFRQKGSFRTFPVRYFEILFFPLFRQLEKLHVDLIHFSRKQTLVNDFQWTRVNSLTLSFLSIAFLNK